MDEGQAEQMAEDVYIGEDETDAEPAGLDAPTEPATVLLLGGDEVAAGTAERALDALGEQSLAPVEVVVVPGAERA